MQKNYAHLVLVAIVASIVIMSCTNSKTGNPFPAKADSVRFANAVYKLYPAEVRGIGDTSSLPGDKDGVHPIPWDTVQAYQAFYDKEPKIFDLKGEAYKGFGVDPKGYQWITGNTAIKGLYLRLGRKGDGAYTMMLLGTDSAGNLLNTKASRASLDSTLEDDDPTNFDNTMPCPQDCPDNDN